MGRGPNQSVADDNTQRQVQQKWHTVKEWLKGQARELAPGSDASVACSYTLPGFEIKLDAAGSDALKTRLEEVFNVVVYEGGSRREVIKVESRAAEEPGQLLITIKGTPDELIKDIEVQHPETLGVAEAAALRRMNNRNAARR